MIQNFLLGSLSYSVVDRGIANMLCVETLAHGTDPVAYVNIRLQGSDAQYDVTTCGRNTPPEKKRFYVLKENYVWWHGI